VRAASISGV
jgi:hypothetical protein